MQMTMGEVADLLQTSAETAGRTITGYSIDTRTLKQGDLFFAIKGPRFDGHDFVGQALELGAAGAVVEKAFREKAGLQREGRLLAVENPTKALQDLGKQVRRKWGKQLIAITGSAGKTTTKELIASLLSERYKVLKSPGNLNNYYGVPLALLNFEPADDLAVLELAMSAPGEIALLAQISEPQIGVVTNVAAVHLEFFDSVDSIAKAKRELIENLPASGTAVLNFDDPRVKAFEATFKGKVVSFGFEDGAEFQGSHLHPTDGGGSRFMVRSPGFEREFLLPLPGRHNAMNALAAIATASLFGVSPEQIVHALSERPTLHQRSEIITVPAASGDVTLLNDCYNSNPLAMERMLETLAAWPESDRRIVVAGEMLELGSLSPEWHRNVGRECAESRVDWLLAVQGDARFFVEGAVEAGFPAEQAKFFETPEQAAEASLALLRPRDVVLIKGSRGVHLEKVTELLQKWQEPPAGSDGPQQIN